MEIRWKVWLQEEDCKVFGRGPVSMLKWVDELGSINKAAVQMGMSYSKAMRLIANIETHMGFSVVERQVGGVRGGGSRLTSEARDLIDRFEAMETEIRAFVEKCGGTYFR